MDSDLTERQAQVLDFIRGYMVRHEIPPSQITIAKALRVTRTTALYHVRQLVLKGRVRKERNLFIPVRNGEDR